MTSRELRGTLLCIALLVVGCSSPSGPAEQSPAEASGSKAGTTEPQAPPATPPESETAAALPEAPAETVAPVPESPAATPAPLPATPAKPSTETAARTAAPVAPVVPVPARPAPAASSLTATTAAAPAPAPQPIAQAQPATVAAAVPPANAAIVDPGGAVAVAATKPGLKRIGSDACGDCHEVQFDSWAEGGHASRKPPLDCEGCHGPGSEYKPNAIMKDPAKAKAAGLVMPDKAFCSQCHKTGVNDELMKRAHAHEE